MEWLVNNWMLILGAITTPIAWIFGGKQAKAQEMKKGEADIKKGNADAVATMQGVYDQFLEDYKARMSEVINELSEIKINYQTLQGQFNEIQLAYAKEVERSQNWEKLHRELTDKYNALEKDHDQLKALYEKLKREFDQHKKTTK